MDLLAAGGTRSSVESVILDALTSGRIDAEMARTLLNATISHDFATLEQIKEQLPETLKPEVARVDVKSSYFEVFGRLRLEDRVIEEHSLVERRGPDRGLAVIPLQRDRRALQGAAP